MSVKLLTNHHFEFLSLKGGCTGSSECTLVKMPHCWKSHAAAQLFLFLLTIKATCPHVAAHSDHVPQSEKTCLRGFVNNTGADQPAHPRSLISTFAIRFLESIICKLNTGEITSF